MAATLVARLNELLEAERAGVEVMSRLLAEAPAGRDDALRAAFEHVRDDEAWSCAGLARAIDRLGGPRSSATGDFTAKVFALATLPDRLAMLNRGQRWVMRRLEQLGGEKLDEDTVTFLREMHARHARNVATCDELVARLAATR